MAKMVLGFTLAEILIVVGVVGVVATTAIPPLIENVNERLWSARSRDTLAKLSEATNQMKVEDRLSGFANTDKFVDELQKKIKTTKRCDAQNLDKCFISKFKSGEDTIETKDLQTIKKLWRTSKDANNNTVGLVTLDGMPMIMAFDQTCERLDPFSSTPRGTNGISATLGCLHMLYDTNGGAKPNTIGKDIKNFQVAFKNCEDVPNGPCIMTTDMAIKPINTCDPNLVLDNGKKASYYDKEGAPNADCATNRWAGAMKACDDADMVLPTIGQLAQLATYLYGCPVSWHGALSAPIDRTKAIEYGLESNNFPYGPKLWTSLDEGCQGACVRSFYPGVSTSSGMNKSTSSTIARCVAK